MKNLSSKKKDIIVGLIILVVVAGIFYFFKNRANSLKVPETNEPTINQIEQNLKDKFNFNVPGDVEKTDLKDVSGGDGVGIATRTEILADLADPNAGYFYQAWLEKDEKLVSLGKLGMAKGGWLISYSSSKFPGYDKVVISLEKVFDNNLEKRVLEGSF